MKVRKADKFSKKSFLVFDPKKRRDYVTGFEKRKQERKEKAKAYNEAKAKEERRQRRSMKRQKVKEMLDKYEEEMNEEDEWKNPSMVDDSSDDDDGPSEVYKSSTESAVLSNEIKTKCGTATVEISTLGLSSNHFLGQNSDFANCKPNAATLASKYGHLPSKSQEKKSDVTSQSFSELVKGVMKKATKQAKKDGKIVSFIDKKKKKFNSNVKDKFKAKKKTKRLVTEL